jgi:phosphomannomutase
MSVGFGTSGLRGLVTSLTETVVADYTRAFLAACPHNGRLSVGQDLRPSSPQISDWIIATAMAEGLDVYDCGPVPTPALALRGTAAIMVTGSHIPADRNGMKFYTPMGEISKSDEGLILGQLGRTSSKASGTRHTITSANADYIARYVTGFGDLAGLRIGVYQHSSVARDVMMDLVTALGATAIALGRADHFIPVDTEALPPQMLTQLQAWSAAHHLDAIISADGDADRPLLADQNGQVIKGDILGILTAQYLGAEVICTPISTNSMVNTMAKTVHLTKIGSPYVIAAMQKAAGRVVGFEANGGFLLGFTADGPLPPLMTRDAILPILAPLMLSKGRGLAALVASLPPRFTAADRLTEIDMAKSAALLAALRADAAHFFGTLNAVDQTDGLRVTLTGGQIIHLRPSGNAPEFRCYVEAESQAECALLLADILDKLRVLLS